MDFKISVATSDSINLLELKSLYKRCRWDWLEPDSEMRTALQGFFRLITATNDGRHVGFARMISDGKICALLIDCMVDPEFRNRGAGQALVDCAISECRRGGIKVIQLLASVEGVNL